MGVVLVGRCEAKFSTVCDSIGLCAPVLVVRADITCSRDRRKLQSMVEQRLTAEHGRAFAVNVTAPLGLTQSFLPSMRRAQHARILKVNAEVADHAQPGTGIFGITKKALARLFDQMIADFAHEPGGDFPAIAPLQPSLVETEGLLREHIDAAQACGLPFAARLGEPDVRLPIWVNHPVVASSQPTGFAETRVLFI